MQLLKYRDAIRNIKAKTLACALMSVEAAQNKKNLQTVV